MNDILGRTTRRAYTFEVTPDLTFSVRFAANNREVPRSTGENQLTTLLFTAALVDFARARMGEKDALFVPGAVAPLVLDSPFGNLDQTYRGAIAAEIPKMADQVVLFLSSSQASSEVMEAIGDRIGKHYLCRVHNTESRGRRPIDSVIWQGVKYPAVEFGARVAMTEIVELPV